MADKPSGLAIAAFCLTVVNILFSAYQWWNGQSDARMTAAIELSKQAILSPEEGSKRNKAAIALMQHRQLDADQATALHKWISEAEYMAFLINRKKLDPEYISGAVKCGIYGAYQISGEFKKVANFADTLGEMETFSRTAGSECEPHYQSFLIRAAQPQTPPPSGTLTGD
jgi:hypothetical protein